MRKTERLDKDSLAEHVRVIQNGTPAEANRAKELALAGAHQFIVYAASKAFMSLRGTSYTKEDAIIDGQIGFINALHRANPDNLALHYFYIYIQSAVKEGFVNQLLPVYAPIARKWDYWKYRTSRSSLIQELRREPTDEEILERTRTVTGRGLTQDELDRARALFPETEEIPFWVESEEEMCPVEKSEFYSHLYEASSVVRKPMELLGWLGLVSHVGRKPPPTHLEEYRRELRNRGLTQL